MPCCITRSNFKNVEIIYSFIYLNSKLISLQNIREELSQQCVTSILFKSSYYKLSF